MTGQDVSELKRIRKLLEKQLLLCADCKIKQLEGHQAKSMREYEFSVFSQWGQDGIIQYLIRHVPIDSTNFVEFGVQDYTESNTKFLLMHDNWSGLVIDSEPKNISTIKHSQIYWKYNLNAITAFITKENINRILSDFRAGDIGLLSIDIDGNDYWIWDSITAISPRIVICEFNSVFGNTHKITVPYDPDFNRTRAHYSNLYFGASLPALYSLAEKKGYSFVGCNSAGNDAFFVRNDVAKNVKTVSLEEGYVLSQARESRGENGEFTYLSGDERIKLIQSLPIFEIEQKKLTTIEDLLRPDCR